MARRVWVFGLFFLDLIVVEAEFQGLAALIANDAALFQGVLVESDHIAAGALDFISFPRGQEPLR